MPNQRAEGQKLLTVPVSGDFIKEVDAALRTLGIPNRSQFIRDAILEKIELEGIVIPKDLALSPERTGKGGPQKRVRYPGIDSGNVKLNESSSSSGDIKKHKAAKPLAAADGIENEIVRKARGKRKRSSL